MGREIQLAIRTRRRRRRGLVTPEWAPNQIDLSIDDITPFPGWMVVEEQLHHNDDVNLNGVDLRIARPGVSNTVYGKILAMNEEDTFVSVGDTIVYREWEGGRWNFDGQVVLLLQSEHVLALVV